MRSLKHSSILWKTFGLIILFIIGITCLNPSPSTKGKVIQIDPNSVQYLANSFDQLLVFFLEKRNQEFEYIFEEFIKNINQTFPKDHTLYAVTYFKKDAQGKLAKFNNKSDGFRIITKRNHYEMQFNNQIRQFQLLKKFYSHHVHPVLPIFVPSQFTSVQTQYFVVLEYNTADLLNEYIKIYPKLYDFLKVFNVRAIAVQSQKNQSKISIYKKSNIQEPIATYGGQFNNTGELIDFINVETLPLLTNLNDQNYVRIFGSFLDTQLLFIYDKKNELSQQIDSVRQQLKQVAAYNREQELKYHRILFAESSTEFLGKYFDQSIQQLVDDKGQLVNYKIVLTKTDYGHFQLRRFNYEISQNGLPNKQNIIKFIDDVRMKRIDAEYKSQKIPEQLEQNTTILRKIVGNSFISQIYQRPHESVIVLFIDSKDPESYKDIKQALQNFTSTYKTALEGKVVSAIFDLAKNENKLLSIRTAPMLSLFERTNKKSPKNFKGYPKVQSIKNWINYQIKDFTIPQNFGQEILPLGGAPSTPSTDNNAKTSQQL